SDDRILLDIGSLYTKVGFAGEHSPRFISVLMPVLLKQTLAKVLFERFRIATLFFAPAELATVLTTGQSAGLVLECGHLETTITPVYDYRVLATNARAVPLAGDCVLANLKDLLTKFGSLL
ncbi:hypothetical protein BCR44DRAFT_1371806, partial [Catenaria anguillulae PL171]